MENSVSGTNHRRQQSNVDRLTTPQMRQQIVELTRSLEQCSHPLFNHLGSLNTIFEALNTARQSADCLLTDEPFEAWEQLMREGEWEDLHDTLTSEKQKASMTAAPNVKRMTTQPMRRQVVEAIRRLDDYHGGLTAFLNDLSKLESFETAQGFAKDLQSDRALETAEARTKREESEAEELFAPFEALRER
jgi:hypothetical protein